MIRSFLHGTFQNTAFCLLAPNGKERLSRTGRSPKQALGPRGRGGGKKDYAETTVEEMNKIAAKYEPKGDLANPVVQDFHSFRQALNVASGDQRLLLFVSSQGDEQETIRKALSTVVGDPEIVGRFHVDFAEEKGDEKWQDAISEIEPEPSAKIYVIQSGKFGQSGSALEQLPADASVEDIKAALIRANETFASREKRKVYSEHVVDGRREKIYFEGGVEYGEDRDGDGEIDSRRGHGGGRNSGRGGGRGGRGGGRGGRRGGR